MHKLTAFSLALLMAGFSIAVIAQPFSFGLFGDTPYNQWEREQLPDLIAQMDAEQLDFVVNDGDIKSGGSLCSDEVFKDIFGVFNSSATPLIYVPGDNEWTDCHRKSNGSYDPVERLTKLRELFFASDRSLGKRSIPLQRQSLNPAFAKYRENVRWALGGVLFVGLNLPGSSNNFHGTEGSGGPVQEFVDRGVANRAWLAESFALARKGKLAGLLLVIQANPDFQDFNEDKANPGFQDFLIQLREETQAFSGQVVLVHGDTHKHKIDQPLRDQKTGAKVANFTRVETIGSPSFGWIKGTADARDPKVFRFQARPWNTR